MAKSNSFSSQPLKMEQSLPWDKTEYKTGPKNILPGNSTELKYNHFSENNAYKSHGFCAGSIFHRKKRRKGRGREKKSTQKRKIYLKCEFYLLDIKETSVRGSLLLSWHQKAPFFGPLVYFGRSFYAIARGYLVPNQLNGFCWRWPFFRQRMFPDFFIKWIMWFFFLCLMIWLS